MPTLHLGVQDTPYSFAPEPNRKKVASGSQTTGDVAEILEAKYHIMESFFKAYEQQIADVLTESVAGAIEDLLLGKPVTEIFKAAMGTAAGASKIKQLFNKFIDGREIEKMGIPGVPTKAALMGVNHRLGAKKGAPRPSFRDTGLFEATFQAWVD